MLVLQQQEPRRVLHLRQRSKISTPPSPTRKLRPAKSSNLFCLTNYLLTNVVRKIYLLGPRNPSRPLGVRLRGLHLRWLPLLGSGQLHIGGGGSMGANFLGDWRHRHQNLRNCPDRPSPEGEVLLTGMRDMVIRVPAPCVSHPFDVEHGAGLAGRLYWRRREIDACEACLAGDEPHRSRVLEESPPPINVGVVISHGV